MSRTRILPVAGATLVGSVLLVAAVLTVLAPSPRSALVLGIGMIAAVLYVATGLLVARRAPGNPVGGFLLLAAVAIALTVARETGWSVVATVQDPDGWAWPIALLEEASWWGFVVLAMVFLHFPDGRLPGRRWRWLPPALVGAAAVVHLRGVFGSAPFRPPVEQVARPVGPPPGWLDVMAAVAVLVILLLVVVAAASPWWRARRGDKLLRRQVRWLGLAAAGLPLFPVLCLVEIAVWGSPLWTSLTIGVGTILAVPVAVAVAVLRHDLYDVDALWAGTLTWSSLSAVLVLLYLAISWGVGVLVGGQAAVAAAAATAACAVALQPLRRSLQSRVDQVAYPLRRAAFRAVADLRDAVDQGAARPEQLEAVLRSALRDRGLRIGYASPGAGEFLDLEGRRVPSASGVPVALGGAEIGVLHPGPRAGASAVLLRQVAQRAVGLVDLVRIRQELAHLVDEVAESRRRILLSAYEERRRLERDLHDGAQQRLVALGMDLRTAQRRLRRGRGGDDLSPSGAFEGSAPAVDLDGLLDRSVAQLGTAVAELRRIAHGIRPSTLDDGLRPALAALARTVPVDVEVELDVSADRLPDAVATTAYFVVSEALANAIKHADARVIRLRVRQRPGCLQIEVEDDGRGGAQLGEGSAIRDRVGALGGSVRVTTRAASGSLVQVELPCAS